MFELQDSSTSLAIPNLFSLLLVPLLISFYFFYSLLLFLFVGCHSGPHSHYFNLRFPIACPLSLILSEVRIFLLSRKFLDQSFRLIAFRPVPQLSAWACRAKLTIGTDGTFRVCHQHFRMIHLGLYTYLYCFSYWTCITGLYETAANRFRIGSASFLERTFQNSNRTSYFNRTCCRFSWAYPSAFYLSIASVYRMISF